MKSEKHDRNKERTNKKNLDTQYGEKTPLKLSNVMFAISLCYKTFSIFLCVWLALLLFVLRFRICYYEVGIRAEFFVLLYIRLTLS